MTLKQNNGLAIAEYAASSWGTAFYLVFIRLAIIESHLSIWPIVAFRFLIGVPLTHVALRLVTRDSNYYQTKHVWLQVKRSMMLFIVTAALIAASKALRNVALANAYQFTLFGIVVLRTRFVRKLPVHPLGWLSVALCVGGVTALAVASGSAGAQPLLGLCLVLVAMHSHAMMMEYAQQLSRAGDSSYCSLFWTGVVGFALVSLFVLFHMVDVDLGYVSSALPTVDVTGVLMMLGVTAMAILPQLGYADAGRRADPLTLAPAGLTQIIPAIASQMWFDHGRLPNALAITGIATLLVSAWCSVQGQKKLLLAATR